MARQTSEETWLSGKTLDCSFILSSISRPPPPPKKKNIQKGDMYWKNAPMHIYYKLRPSKNMGFHGWWALQYLALRITNIDDK